MYIYCIFMKGDRQREILRIVAEREVLTQEQLSRLLARRGHRVDQATLSRDLRTMGVAKVADNGGQPRYRVVGEPAPATRGFEHLIRSVEKAGTLVVVRTGPGDASRVGLALDRAGWAEIAGTVAGDDTLMIVVRSGHRSTKVARRLLELMKR